MRKLLGALLLAAACLTGCRTQSPSKAVDVAPPVAVAVEPAPPPPPTIDQLADANTDATALIQSLLDAQAAARGGMVALPAGRFRLDGSLRIPTGVTLEGTWTAPHHASLKTGTVLLAYGGRGMADGPPLIALDPGACLRGVTIYYPEQTIDNLTPYPWSIRGRGMHCTIENVTLVNPWQAIDFGTEWNELHTVRNVFGCPLKTGVYIDGCTDIGRLENVHFNPHYWFRDEGDGEPRPDIEKLFTHLVTQADAFVFGRTDWEYVLNTFCYGYRAGYRFIQTEKGVCNGNFLGIGGDGCQNAVLIEASAPYGLLFTNGEFVSLRAEHPVQILSGPKNTGVAQFTNCAFWGPVEQVARIENGRISFSQCNFHHWDHRNEGRPAIEALRGSLMVQNCFFHRGDGTQVRLGEGVKAAVVSGNVMFAPVSIQNESKANGIVVRDNVSTRE